MSLIPQDPRSALHPYVRVGAQMELIFAKHPIADSPDVRPSTRVRHQLTLVGLDPDRVPRLYPHQLSGGMAQRVLIAVALGVGASLLIADEPTTGLDATVAAATLDALKALAQAADLSVLLITHDLGVVAHYSTHVVVMHAGRVVEQASTEHFFASPAHPYSRALLDAMRDEASETDVPSSVEMFETTDAATAPSGCRYRLRCDRVSDVCQERPPLIGVGGGAGLVLCHHPLERGEQ